MKLASILDVVSHLPKDQPDATERRIAFMHIPKTSGMAMTDMLSGVLNARCELPYFDRSLFGGFNAFDTIAPALREKIHIGGRLCSINTGDFIAGHFAFSTLNASCPEADLMTVLREPGSRVLSHWVYWRTSSDDQLALWGGWAVYVKRARQELVDFLDCPEIACQTDNLITRMLLWPHPLIPVDDFIEECDDGALVAAASKALDGFAFVDTIENPDFHANLQAWFGRPLEYRERNKTHRVAVDLQSPLEKELGCYTLKLLERRTRLDSRLWLAIVRRLSIADDVALFARNTLMRNIARLSRLMAA